MSVKYPWVPDDAKVQYPWAKVHGKHLYKNRTIEENMIVHAEQLCQIGQRMDSATHRASLRELIEKTSLLIDEYESREGVVKTTTPRLTNSNGSGPWIPNYKGD